MCEFDEWYRLRKLFDFIAEKKNSEKINTLEKFLIFSSRVIFSTVIAKYFRITQKIAKNYNNYIKFKKS